MMSRPRFAPRLGALVLASQIAVFSSAGAASLAPVAAPHAMVVTAQHLATEVGVEVLRQGGNAIDAAVAVGYALAVVYPAAGNLGGGGFMVVQFADGRRTFLDFRERAPLAARADMYLDAQGNVRPGSTTDGWLAVAVPGSVSGLEYAREHYGTRPAATLLEPAIRLAREGFLLQQGDADILSVATRDFRGDPATASIFLHGGEPLVAGDRLIQQDLAATLERIRDGGARAFYRGKTAEAILAASRAGGGILAQADFEQYETHERAPVECDYRGYHVISAPPPSSGGVIVCEILNVLEGYPLHDLGFRSAQAVHFQIEAMRHAYFDRNNALGDPDFVRNPLAHLLDKGYAASLRAAIDPARAARSSDLVNGRAPHEGINTTHYSILDAQGNAVSVTYTLDEWFGIRRVAPGTGVLLNDEMDDFTAKVGTPNLFGLVQGERNAIAPGKRPLSSMSPTIVTRDGKVVMVLGTPGGSRIISTVVHAIVNVIDYGMDIQEAVDAPRFHQQWEPETTALEPFALSPDTRRLLEGMGHRFTEVHPVNHLAAILVGAPALGAKPVGLNRVYGANDPRRRTGMALGY